MSKSGIRSLLDRRSIRYPLARLIVTAVLMAIGLALLSDVVLMLDSVRKDIRRTMTNAGNAAGSAADAAVVFKDAKAAQEVLRMFEAYPEVESAALYTADGGRLASYGNASQLPVLARRFGPSMSDIEFLAENAELHLPIVVDGAPVGSIQLRVRLQSYWQTYLSSIATTFMVALIAGVLALILAMRFLDRIIQPVRMLAEAAEDARLRQDFAPRAIAVADDEIGDLVSNFNALLAEVEAGRLLLQRQHDELEHLVTERTAELLAAKESADEANAAKSRFLAAASHDLRQPIHAMRLFLETLSSSPLNDEQRRIANYLTLSTHSLADILNALLDVSRLDGGRVNAQPEVFSAYALLRNIEAEFAPLALAKGLRFKFCFPNNELMLYSDARLLYSLLRNIIDNAIKYTRIGGVLIGFRRRRNSVLIQVWDTGIGIAPDQLEVVFDEYFQVGNSQRDRSKGLGLGLAIARRLGNVLGSPIRCQSRLNSGSMFEICVPLADSPVASEDIEMAQMTTAALRPSQYSALQVVVIDDDEMAARALELSLTAQGMNVHLYADAEQALADPRCEQADFYFVDHRLPGMNGMQFLDALQCRAARPLKAALLTGESHLATLDNESTRRWKVILKPVESAALIAEMEAQGLLQHTG